MASSSSACAVVALASSQVSGLASRYRRLDESSGSGAIGKGSFGSVYVALDTTRQETVAVKRQVLPSDAAMKELCFYKALSQVRHPNVMNLLDHFIGKGAAGTCLYLVFDFMDTTLWHMWKHRHRLLPVDTSTNFVSDLVAGLSHLHQAEIIHSDLSMANLLVGAAPQWALSQGTSRQLLRITDLGGAISASGMVLPLGRVITTEYARAPEMLFGSTEPTVAVDLWSLGVVTLALMCGSLVFWRPSGLEPSVEGLLSAGDGEGITHVPGATTLSNQVAFLGCPDEDVVQRFSLLPRWSSMRHAFNRRAICAQPELFLGDINLVRRPLASSDAAVDFIVALLCWDPARRLRAKQCLEHAFLRSLASTPCSLRSIVSELSNSSLQDLVLQSLHSGQPVQFDRTLDLALELTRVEPGPSSQAVVLESSVSTCVPEPVTVVPKRRRLWQKTSEYAWASSHGSAVASDHLLSSRSGVVRPLVAAPVAVSSVTCACKGNCGLHACKSRKNSYGRGYSEDSVFCKRSVAFRSRFCVFCKCERCDDGCRQETHGHCRWCSRCVKKYNQASSQVTYHNKYGTFRVQADWSLPLKLTARFAWASTLAPGVESVFSIISWMLFWCGVAIHRCCN